MREDIARDLRTRAAEPTQLQGTSWTTRGTANPGLMLNRSPVGCGGRAGEGVDIAGIGDDGGDAFAEQSVSARARGAGYWAGDRADRAADLGGAGGDVERARSVAGLHDHGRARDSAQDSVAGEKAPLGRRGTGGHLADEQTNVPDAFQQLVIACRVETVQAAGEHRDRLPSRSQGSAMGGPVDAIGTAGDDDPLGTCQIGGKLDGDVLAVPGGCTGAGDRHFDALLH